MKKSILVATSSNGGIGKDNALLWHLPADMKFFKEKTMGHHIIMGRKTYESIGKPLPGRTTIIITRDKNFQVEGCTTVHSIEDAFKVAENNGETEAFITGGAEIYKQSLPFADCIYQTRVEGEFVADTFFQFDASDWKETEKKEYKADEKNKFPYCFVTLHRIQ